MESALLSNHMVFTIEISCHAYGFNIVFLGGTIHAGIDELFCHHLSPFFDPTLECPELTAGENPWTLPLETTEQFFGCGVWITL
jgi:hypothetical protein